jgi:hypothetical protein
MQNLFSKERNIAVPSFSIMNKLAALAKKKLQFIALWLQQRTKTWSRRKWLMVLLVFCLASIFVTTRVVVLALSEKKETITIKQDIRSLQHFQPVEPNASLQTTLKDLKHFKSYLDSLKTFDAAAFDSISKGIPLLPDSLNMLINIYELQLNNER